MKGTKESTSLGMLGSHWGMCIIGDIFLIGRLWRRQCLCWNHCKWKYGLLGLLILGCLHMCFFLMAWVMKSLACYLVFSMRTIKRVSGDCVGPRKSLLVYLCPYGNLWVLCQMAECFEQGAFARYVSSTGHKVLSCLERLFQESKGPNTTVIESLEAHPWEEIAVNFLAARLMLVSVLSCLYLSQHTDTDTHTHTHTHAHTHTH